MLIATDAKISSVVQDAGLMTTIVKIFDDAARAINKNGYFFFSYKEYFYEETFYLWQNEINMTLGQAIHEFFSNLSFCSSDFYIASFISLDLGLFDSIFCITTKDKFNNDYNKFLDFLKA